VLIAVDLTACVVVGTTRGLTFYTSIRPPGLIRSLIRGSTPVAEAVKLAVRTRTVLGKKSERLRRQGILPGVVFGGHKDSIPVETDAHAFELGFRRWGSTTLLSLEGLDGDGTPALIHDVSRDPVTGRLMHIDFERVSLTERTHAEVPLHFVGASAAVKNGAVLVHARDHVRVEALPQDIPHSIEVDLSRLETIDDAVHVRDLIVDTTKVEILDRPEELVVKAVPQKVEEVPVVVAPTVEGAVPAEGEAAEGEAPAAAGAAPAAGAKPGAPAAKPGAPAAKGAEKK
jgi:large subunit ribosomal protein L25